MRVRHVESFDFLFFVELLTMHVYLYFFKLGLNRIAR